MNILLVIIILAVIGILFWALFGTKEELGDSNQRKQNNRSSDTTELIESPERELRRRTSDQEIEKEIEEKQDFSSFNKRDSDKKQRRKNDSETDKENDFLLPYLSNEIIPKNSRFKIYQKTLLNSEIYAKKEDFSTSISLYEGVYSRIYDENTRSKIQENIDYIRNFKNKKKT